ncbi:MAG: hypothetical protein A2Y95_04895 [Deltaproteobacteria bacterium RBG_13_65_10]|nr:MAG: hypothetical protein A2Y95_04895 [Deltaproteobacteria bacterium RBG_13_65_10]
MRCDHYTMREKVNLEPSFPADLRACLVATIDSLSLGEALAALRRREHEPDNFDGLLAGRLTARLPTQWRLRRTERVAEGPGFKNDFSLLAAGGAVSVEIEKKERGRFDLDLMKMLAFATRHHPVPAFGVLVVSSSRILPSDVAGNHRETAFDYLKRTLALLWRSHRGNLEDVLVIGYDEGEGTELRLPEIPPSSGDRPTSTGPDIVKGTQGLGLDEIARMVGGPLGEVFRRSPALSEIRRVVLHGRAVVTEKLNRGPVKYLGYRARGKDHAYVYVQNAQLVVDVDVPRTEENLRALSGAGIVVATRRNRQWKAGWLTGIRLPHQAPPEQASLVADAIVKALTRGDGGGLFREPGA